MKAGGRRRLWSIVVAGVAVVLLAIGLAVFKPWLLFIDVRVDEQIPTVAASSDIARPSPSASLEAPSPPGAAPTRQAPAGPVQLAAGSLISHEHATSGSVRILGQPNGDRLLILENLDTSNGPDVHVWLSAADVVEGTGGWFTAGGADHHDLGLIKGNQGNQVYAIPAGVDLKKYKSVDLWCVQFSVSFGAAQLTF
ncbi:DM13 domain-containing protein [Arthrobacter sp. Soil736]|uniref:DM13 domain-containing protein n=1 Tax=Arthrobacter sp. Soil736 TaxID=1736395 RepID=UPI000AF40429|nr:DM13 domain-containing protein [Arthrobacter sp. Soil736]